MDFVRLIFTLVLAAILFIGDGKALKLLKRSKRNHVSCRPKSLVMYRLTVHTLWSKETFPKMFPTYRPHAQFSALVGRTHGSDYQLWEEGVNATLGVKLFAEQGDPSQLNVESVQGYDDILDSFVAPPVNKSVGKTSTVIILDGHHSKISFLMKIVPSPDWFIGVSNLDLCAHGRWKNKVQVDMRPFDSGTDQGLTFTAPNWPNTPVLPIQAITSSFPDHPASSFFYPEYQELPRLAFVELDIVSEYRHRETFMKIPQHHQTSTGNDEEGMDRKSRNHETSTTSVSVESKLHKDQSFIYRRTQDSTSRDHNSDRSMNEDISATLGIQDLSKAKRTNSQGVYISDVKDSSLKAKDVNDEAPYLRVNNKETFAPVTQKADTLNNFVQSTSSKWVLEETRAPYITKVDDDNYINHGTLTRDESTGKTGVGESDSVSRSGDKSVDKIGDKESTRGHVFSTRDIFRGSSKSHWKTSDTASTSETTSILPDIFQNSLLQETSTRHIANMRGTSAVDCEVGEWSEWSACSQTCGFGQQERFRNVSSYPKNGGANCPRLRHTNWCGSMRNCAWNHFSFLEPNVTKRQLREGQSRRHLTSTHKRIEKDY